MAAFDDAQAMVKRMFGDAEVTQRTDAVGGQFDQLGAADGAGGLLFPCRAAIWARLNGRIAFSVPTGNFGDVFAGYVAAQMGLPVERLIVATNVNDILHRALAKGDYSVGTVTPTAAPSMDIQVSSNFERLLFDLEGRDGATTAARMKWFEQMGKMALSSDMRRKAACSKQRAPMPMKCRARCAGPMKSAPK
jgi:threonine synthase